MLKKLIAVCCVCAVLFSLSSCKKDDGHNRSFVYPIASDPGSLDPQICANDTAGTVINNLFEGLVRLDESGAIIPGVAETVDVSADGLAYTFYLRKDTKWHLIDNFKKILGEDFKDTFETSVTAHDFVFGFRRALSPETNAPNADTLFVIQNAQAVNSGALPATELGVEAVDNHTLRITLGTRCADFLLILTQPICMPCSETFFTATKGKYGLSIDYTLCNGPFYLSKWSADKSMLLRRHVDYCGESVAKPLTVSLYVKPYEAGFQKEVSDGTYDAGPINEADAAQWKNAGRIKSYQNTTWSLCFNTAGNVLGNLNVRLALCRATDYNMFEFPGERARANGLLPGCVRVGDKEYREVAGSAVFPQTDAAQAKDLWEQGLKELELSSAGFTVLCTPENEQPVKRVIQRWQQAFGVSVKVSVNVKELPELKKAVESGNYDAALYPVTVQSASAVLSLTDFLPGAKRNIVGLNSETYSNIVREVISAGTSMSVVEGCRTAETFLLQNAAVYPLYHASQYFALAENAEGIYLCPAGKTVSFMSAVKFD
ncbi:MAG: peptide ABC transporter substrate-binding protein [Oscillospiraceae bacterium]|nr:peptide ABC transporter substrate-binding protein [Oscillospiraceae bacterium]